MAESATRARSNGSTELPYEEGQRRLTGGLSGEIDRVLHDVAQIFRDSEARIQAILLSAADAIITIDSAGTIESFNPAAEQMFGYDASEVVGHSVDLLMPEPPRSPHRETISRYIATGTSEVVGHRRRLMGRRKNGSAFPIELAVSAMRLGSRSLFTGIARDISAQEEAERAVQTSRRFFRATLDSLPQHIAILDDRGVILEVNAAWRRFSRDNCLAGTMQSIGDCYLAVCDRSAELGCEEARRAAAGIRLVIRGEQEHFQMEYPCHSDREHRWFALHVTRFVGDQGVRAVVAHENISGRKMIELELESAKEAAELGNRMRDEFLAMLSHELRNPLAPIRHAAEILQQEGVPAEVRDQTLRTLAEQVDHVVHLVDDLLDVTRIERGKIRVQCSYADLRECVRRAVEATRPLLVNRRHELRLDLPGQPVPILADADRIQQVVANLVNNAAKYTHPGGRITVAVRIEGREVVLSVRDNGIGLRPEDRERVFDAFVQADASDGGSQGGLGIGLTLVRRLIELHEGTIRAESDGLDKGCCFVVRLPLLADAEELRQDLEAAPCSAVGGSGHRLLVVDDNRAAADMLAALLEVEGFEVSAAYDGASAIELAGLLRPHVVLLDVRMPHLDGYEVARQLRENPLLAETRLVAMTGMGRRADVERSFRSGFDRHLVKPVHPDELRNVLGELLRAQAAELR